MGDQRLTNYVVTHDTDRWLFVPSTMLAGMMTFGFAAGSALMFYLSSLVFRNEMTLPTNLFGPILLLTGSIFAAWAIRAWRTRRTPLTIESGGRVSYGDHELCAPGTVRSVRIVEARRRGRRLRGCHGAGRWKDSVHTIPILRQLQVARACPPVRRETRRSTLGPGDRTVLISGINLASP